MDNRVYTLLDLAEEFGKDKQFIRRRIMKLKLKSINKDSREHLNEPLEYDYHTYLKLAEEFGLNKKKYDMYETRNKTQSNARETRGGAPENMDDLGKDRLIEVLERELEHSKGKLEKAEDEKQNLMRLLDQQQRLSLQANQKIEMLEYKKKEDDPKVKKDKEAKKWWQFWK